ncbi:BQ5605_C002g01082 [Microbotryum silenes-dioicae]|uniref:BQ5605_C002g01082 protein n=1 Tax=Microbotryum silenes-dioicae TaxID=796604 RepID=A0A2X0M1L8_9BASI|nr:BQ5605_C002g01082 [Microbotryum silenes-dioicae]
MSAKYDHEAVKDVADPSSTQTTISPITGQPIVVRRLPSVNDVDRILYKSHVAHLKWRQVPLSKRIELVKAGITHLSSRATELAQEITEQMGRPIRYTEGEIKTFEDRANWLVGKAESALKDENVDEGRPEGIKRTIRRAPVGITFLIGSWNFPYMIQVNALIPSLLAGNSVILKPSPQTPLTSERVVEAFTAAGLPSDLLQCVHLNPIQMDMVVAHPLVPFVSFTGSVENGRKVEIAAASKVRQGFKMVGLELGGKDAAYVREDSDPKYAAENIVDGAMFNSGQSCCAVERVYVHEKIYDAFVEECVKVVKGYVLGDPREQATTLGPVVSLRSAAAIRSHIAEAVQMGAKALIPDSHFPEAKEGTTYVAPQVLVDVNHSMKVMMEETFGPVMGIMKVSCALSVQAAFKQSRTESDDFFLPQVSSDAEALKLINESPYGLTGSIWTKSEAAFEALVDHVETGTVFMNRCDYLDPALPWTGVKNSGRGISLSRYGFDAVTRAKSVHVRPLA